MDYRKIFLSYKTSEQELERMYYEYFILNNLVWTNSCSSFQESLFDYYPLTEQEQKDFVLILKTIYKKNHAVFTTSPIYLEKVENNLTSLLKDISNPSFEKQIKNLKREIQEQKEFCKANPKWCERAWLHFLYQHGFTTDNIPVFSNLLKQLISSDFLMFSYLIDSPYVISRQTLKPIAEKHIEQTPTLALGSLYYIISNLSLKHENILPLLEEKINEVTNIITKTEEKKDLFFLKKVQSLFLQYTLKYQDSNISYLPIRDRIVYQDEKKEGKVLSFSKQE